LKKSQLTHYWNAGSCFGIVENGSTVDENIQQEYWSFSPISSGNLTKNKNKTFG
jgi:hypothetical protein